MENCITCKEMIKELESLKKELHSERIARVNSDAFYENIISEKNKSLEQQKFNNAYNLSIDQQVSDEMAKLRKENELIRSDLLFLTQPLDNGISLDDLEECFSVLRKKWNLSPSEAQNNSKESENE